MLRVDQVLRELLGRISVRPQEYDDWNSFVKADQTPGLIVGPLDDSVLLDDDGIAIVTENQLFGQRIRQTRRRDKQKTNPDMMIRDLSELQEGSPVVHLDHGVGVSEFVVIASFLRGHEMEKEVCLPRLCVKYAQ